MRWQIPLVLVCSVFVFNSAPKVYCDDMPQYMQESKLTLVDDGETAKSQSNRDLPLCKDVFFKYPFKKITNPDGHILTVRYGNGLLIKDEYLLPVELIDDTGKVYSIITFFLLPKNGLIFLERIQEESFNGVFGVEVEEVYDTKKKFSAYVVFSHLFDSKETK